MAVAVTVTVTVGGNDSLNSESVLHGFSKQVGKKTQNNNFTKTAFDFKIVFIIIIAIFNYHEQIHC